MKDKSWINFGRIVLANAVRISCFHPKTKWRTKQLMVIISKWCEETAGWTFPDIPQESVSKCPASHVKDGSSSAEMISQLISRSIEN